MIKNKFLFNWIPAFAGMILVLLVTTLIFTKSIYGQNVSAKENFLVEADVTYEINAEPFVKVVHEVRLENLTTENYAPSFSFELNGLDIERLYAYDDRGEIESTKSVSNGKTKITLNFADSLVGINKYRNFTVEFIDRSLLSQTGEVWELNLPKVMANDAFDVYDVRLVVPNSFEKMAYISPEPSSSFESADSKIYYFQKDTISDNGVVAAIGEFQTYSYTLKYHLENPLLRASEIDIAIPPDSPYQEIFIEDIKPKPLKIYQTEEGNWMATYKLASRERVDVELTGYVNIYSWPRYEQEFSEEFLEKNLLSNDYWQVDDPQIKALAKELKTPEAIYDYVVDTLTYNYENVTPTTKRLGAVAALNQPDQAICTEFTDLFITIARAAGIPARSVNGYASTDNPSLQPLSLVADVLHAWPEYYDKERKVWIPVDPTWGHTTGGTDYFSKLDLRHFAFVFHGLSSEEPAPPGSYKLGLNPQKDVYISISELPEFDKNTLSVNIDKKDSFIFSPPRLKVKIYNPGPQAIYNKDVIIKTDDQVLLSRNIEILLPFNQTITEITLPYGILGTKMPEKVSVEFAGGTQEITTNRSTKITKDIIAITAIALSIVVATFIYVKR